MGQLWGQIFTKLERTETNPFRAVVFNVGNVPHKWGTLESQVGNGGLVLKTHIDVASYASVSVSDKWSH